jgi:hypothetical protein
MGVLEVNLSRVVFAALLTGLAFASVSAQTISRDSRLLAECEFIYSYTAQLMQLQNNSGAAINILRRSTILTTANMMTSAEGGKIPGWKIKTWTELRPTLKASLDSGRVDPVAEAARCDREAMPIALNIRDQNLRLWGHDFDGLQQELFTKMRASTGI